MISKKEIGNVAEAARYHDSALTKDGLAKADNYYLDEKAVATWQGKGAELIGKEGQVVTREDFVSLLEGKMPHPKTGQVQDLTAAAALRGVERRAGVDFTVAPPKSVSIVALVGKDDRIIDAHMAANKVAMDWLQKHASIVRKNGDNGEQVRENHGNLLYASVSHATNRENEPQLHNHNVIVYAVFDKDSDKWRSLTNDELFKLRAGADTVYKAELATSLRDMGYKLERSENGRDFEIAGLSKEQIEAFSYRTAQIEDALKARGIDPDKASYAARQAATLDSRSVKHELPRDVLSSIWQETAQRVGLNTESLIGESKARAVDETLSPEVRAAGDRTTALRAVSWAIEHLSEREQAYKVADVEQTALKFGAPRLANVEEAVREEIKNRHLVEKGYDNNGISWYTTEKARESERRLAMHIQAGKDRGNVVLKSEDEFEAARERFEASKSQELGIKFRLSDEQVNAARNVLMHGDSYQGIQGDAGTGKTAALAMVREVAEDRGWKVVGVATTASAAKELGAASGIESQTLASFFAERDTAMKLAKAELQELTLALKNKDSLADSAQQRVEHRKLSPASLDIEFGEGRYSFDHQRGDVFKSTNSLNSVIGTFFMDAAEGMRGRLAASGASDSDTLGSRLKSATLAHGIDISESLGRSLTTFEKVGVVEAIAARNALFLETDSERAHLQAKIEVKQAELLNLERTGNSLGKRTLLVMDESSLTGAQDAEKISQAAQLIGARVVLQGDAWRQHESVPAGRAFAQAQDAGINLSVLEETRRFTNATPQTKEAIQLMKAGDYSAAIAALDTTTVKDKEKFAETVAERYLANYIEVADQKREAGKNDEPRIGVVVFTNADRRDVNQAIHDTLQENGLIASEAHKKLHLDDPKLTRAEQSHVKDMSAAGVTHLVYNKTYKEIGVEKGDVVEVKRFEAAANRIVATNAAGREISINPQQQDFFKPFIRQARSYSVGDRVEARQNIALDAKNTPRIDNGTRGKIAAIDEKGASIKWDDGRTTAIDNDKLRFVDLSYARTSFKEQGATSDREIIAAGDTAAKIFHRQSAYVAATRAKENTEVVTTDAVTLQKNADRDIRKTTALDDEELRRALSPRQPQQKQEHQKQIEQSQQVSRNPGFSLGQ